MKTYFFILVLAILAFSCKGPEPRKAIQVKTSTYFGGDIERNKKILATEEALIQNYIKTDSLHFYQPSASGSWYYYQVHYDESEYTAKTGDLVTLTYNVQSFTNDTIYSNKKIGEFTYLVDKQEVFQGLRHAVKLLKENEIATFLYPSSLAYGYQGDGDKIGINTPIIATINILKIEQQQDTLNIKY